MPLQSWSKKVRQQDFNLPHDVIQLPSNGVFYKSKKTIKIK